MQYYFHLLHQTIATKIAEHVGVSPQSVIFSAAGQGIDADISVPCFSFAKITQRAPQIMATELAESLKDPSIARVEAVNGYVNIWLKPEVTAEHITKDFARPLPYGDSDLGTGKTVISEFPSPNMAKPYSVGHLRPALQGWAMYKLMSAMGYTVVRDNHLGDYGTPFGKWAVGFLRYSTETALEQRGIYELSDAYIRITEELKQEKEAGSTELADQVQQWLLKLEAGDPEAVALSMRFNRISLDHMHKVLERLHIKTDEELGESFYIKKAQALVDQLITDGIAEQGIDGSVVIPLDDHGIDTPMLIRKSNGAALYATSDIATLQYRVERWNPAKVLIHTGSEQVFYFKQLFATADRLGYGNVEWLHIWHGIIDQVSEDGKREKMSSRKGVVLLEDLLNIAEERATEMITDSSEENRENIKKVALGAIKFNDFARDIHTGILFDWDSIFSLQGKSGPYVQYAAVRISSIIAKLAEHAAEPDSGTVYDFEPERELLRHIATYPLIVQEAAEQYQAYRIATFLYETAQAWNRYYEKTPILRSEENVRAVRVDILHKLYHVFEHGLDLLGIEVPSRM